ncbi:hypothetical protein CS063_03470 [Sporanaerobium hydrogeniformans]|uniref:Uncharacterized protein n=1 Tax=Sporanaerobium hydrogeniformans TaxID=3072179 RepID=A0AC61DFU0_9FIRM|nr:hypothetical protein [Sporanaerobium hydrogeniformans]PHV71636.1 hypothetical protein CS063_03470 [Sporanaerobium hydrogeniformans]
MTGRENDIKIATVLREGFIKEYNDDQLFSLLLDTIKDGYEERFIHRATKECKLNVVVHYKRLKEMVDETRRQNVREIFERVCCIEEARAWINDNGKYTEIVAGIFYDFYKEKVMLYAKV